MLISNIPLRGLSGFSGLSGYSGRSGFSGVGLSGYSGFSGFSGKDGNFGGAAFDYTYDSAIVAADPGQGKLRFNSTNLAVTTQLYIDALDDFAKDLSSFIASIDDSTSAIKGHFKISLKTDSSTFVFFAITGAVTNNSGWFTVPVAYVNGVTSLTNTDDVLITFARTGDKGDQGLSGFSGFSGHSGVSGYSGVSGFSGFSGYSGLNGIAQSGASGYSGFSGYSGLNGTSGFSGYSGISGFSGTNGASGFSGISGFSGRSGFSGFSGYSGLNGIAQSGISGYSGFSGFSGLNGTSGFSGYSGQAGTSGFSGLNGTSGFSGYSGWSGVSGFSGANGVSGFSGISGFSGYSGKDGSFGGASFDYTYDSTVTAADPGPGRLRLNNITLSSASQLFIDAQDDAARSLTAFLQTIDDSTSAIKGHFKISLKSDATVYAFFAITGAVTDNSGWFTVPVAYVNGVTSLTNLSDVLITFARTGDKGDAGASGFSGFSGWSGVSGYSGFSGFSGATGPSTAINATNDTTTTTLYPVMVGAAGSNQTPKVSTSTLSFDASTGTMNATIFNATSDRKFKDDIAPISNAMSIVSQLQGVTFTWKTSKKKSFGYIAQDVEQIIPEVVATDSYGNKSVNYDATIAILLEAVKELTIRVKDIESKL